MERSAAELCVVLVTAPDEETGRRLARLVVDRRLAACVNLVPGISSTYRWEGAVREDTEVLLLVKTLPDRLAALESALRAAHPYDVPEIVALPSLATHGPYLAWVRTEAGAE